MSDLVSNYEPKEYTNLSYFEALYCCYKRFNDEFETKEDNEIRQNVIEQINEYIYDIKALIFNIPCYNYGELECVCRLICELARLSNKKVTNAIFQKKKPFKYLLEILEKSTSEELTKAILVTLMKVIQDGEYIASQYNTYNTFIKKLLKFDNLNTIIDDIRINFEYNKDILELADRFNKYLSIGIKRYKIDISYVNL